MSIGREVADAYINVHGDLGPFRRDLEKARAVLDRLSDRFDNLFDRAEARGNLFGRRLALVFDNLGKKMRGLAGINVFQDSFEFGIRFMQEIDRNAVRIAKMTTLVGGAIAGVANFLGFIAAASADIAAMANIGFLAPGFLTGFGIAIGVAVAAFKDMGTVLGDLKPAFARLQDSISAKFWEQAEAPIRRLVSALLPTLNKQLVNTARSMGDFTAAFADAFRESATPERTTKMFERLNRAIDIGSKAVAPFTRAMVNLGEVGSKSFERFATWVVKLSNQFDAFIQRSINNGDMDRWIERAIQGFKDMGRALSGMVGIIGAIDSAFRAAGGGGLTYFADRLQEISRIMNGPAFQKGLTEFFIGARAAMQGFFEGLGRLGPAFQSLGPTFIFVGNQLGDVFRSLGTILNNVLGNSQLQMGFREFVESIAQSVRNLEPAAKPFADSLGGILSLMGKVLESVTRIGNQILVEWGPVLDGIGDRLSTLVGPLSDALSKAVSALTPVLETFSTEVADPLITIIRDDLVPAIGDLVDGAAPLLKVAFEELGQLLDDIAPAFHQFREDMRGAGEDGKKMEGDLRSVIQAVEDFLNAASNPLPPGVGLFGDTTAVQNFNDQVNQAFEDFWASIGSWLTNLNTTVNAGLAQFWAGLGAEFAAGWANVGAQWNAFWTGLGQNIGALNESVNAALAQFWAGVGENIASFGASIVEGWNSFWSGLGAAVQTAWIAIQTFIADGITAVQAGLQGFILGIITFWVSFWTNLSIDVQNAFIAVGAAVQAGIAAVGVFFVNLAATIGAGWNAFWGGFGTVVSQAWTNVVAFVTTGINNARNFIASGLAAISAVWNSIWNNVRAFAATIWSNITSAISTGINNARNFVTSGLSSINATWTSIWNGIRSFAQSAWSNITSAVSNGINNARNFVSSGLNSIRSFFSSAWSSMTSLVSSAWSQITSRVSSGVQQAISFVSQLPGRLAGIAGQMASAGVQMMQGFVSGVMSMAGSIVQSALDAVGNAVNAVKSFLGIASPSKLFTVIGRQTGEGFAIGMERAEDLIGAAAEKMAASAINPFSAESMYDTGRTAVEGLADGFSKGSKMLDRALGDITPTLSANFAAMGTLPASATSGLTTAAGVSRAVTIAEGAISIVTPTKDPELLASKVIDEFSNESNF